MIVARQRFSGTGRSGARAGEAAHRFATADMRGQQSSPATSPQVRPWHGPMPQRVHALSWFMSRAPSRTAASISPRVTSSQRHTTVSAAMPATCAFAQCHQTAIARPNRAGLCHCAGGRARLLHGLPFRPAEVLRAGQGRRVPMGDGRGGTGNARAVSRDIQACDRRAAIGVGSAIQPPRSAA